jgi:outer membrane receptor protein involved in Fe transport
MYFGQRCMAKINQCYWMLMACALCSAWPALVSAQQAKLQGTVRNASTGEAVPFATIGTASAGEVHTDERGGFFLAVPAGEITLRVVCMGYRTQQQVLQVGPGEAREMNVQLEPAVAELDMVVVSAGRYEQRLSEVSQSLSVLRQDLVQNKATTNIADALEQVPGLVIMDGEPQLRGGSGFSYGAGSRVMVLVDDLPLLSGDIGRPSWSFLPLENLEQVEVIKGASSVLHGSAALSGVINLRTAYPKAEPTTRVNLQSGLYDTPLPRSAKWWDKNPPLFHGANFFHARRFGQVDLVLGGNAYADAGHIGPERAGEDTLYPGPSQPVFGGQEKRLRMNVGTRWRSKKPGLSYGLNTNVMRSSSNSVFIWDDPAQGLHRPQPETVTNTKATQCYVYPFVQYANTKGTVHKLRGRYYCQRFDNDNDQSNANRSWHGEYQVRHHFDTLGATLTGGLVAQHTASNAQLYLGNAEGSPNNQANTWAAYVQMEQVLLQRINLTGGVRYEEFRVNDAAEGKPVLRLGGSVRVAKSTYLRASFGEGFRFPTIGERFITTSVGNLRIYPNPELAAETSRSVEGGVRQGVRLGKFTGYVDLVAFRQDISDYVEFTFGQWAMPTALNFAGLGFRSVNTGDARITGAEIEFAGRGRLGAVTLSLLMGYTHTLPISTTPNLVYTTSIQVIPTVPPNGITYTSSSSNTEDNVLKFRVEKLWRSDVQVEWRKFLGGASVRYNSHVRNIDGIFLGVDSTGVLPTGIGEWMRTHRSGDVLVDVRLGVVLQDRLRLTLLANNLTNVSYAIRPLAIEAPRAWQVQITYGL